MNYPKLRVGERFFYPVEESEWPYKFTIGTKSVSGWPDKQNGVMKAFFLVPRVREGIYTIKLNGKELGRYYIEGRI